MGYKEIFARIIKFMLMLICVNVNKFKMHHFKNNIELNYFFFLTRIRRKSPSVYFQFKYNIAP